MRFLTDFMENVFGFGESVVDFCDFMIRPVPEEKNISEENKSSLQECWDGLDVLSPLLDDEPETFLGVLLVTKEIIDYLNPQFLPSLKHSLFGEKGVHSSIPEEKKKLSEQDKIWQRRVQAVVGLVVFVGVLIGVCMCGVIIFHSIVTDIRRFWYPDFLRSS